MKPKAKAKKESSERKRNYRNGPLPERETAAEPEVDGKSRIRAELAAVTLRAASNGGIAKASKSKKLTSKQRKRREQMMEKGSMFTEKLSKKALDTEMSQKNVKQRAQDWDQVNEKAITELLETDARVAKMAQAAI